MGLIALNGPGRFPLAGRELNGWRGIILLLLTRRLTGRGKGAKQKVELGRRLRAETTMMLI